MKVSLLVVLILTVTTHGLTALAQPSNADVSDGEYTLKRQRSAEWRGVEIGDYKVEAAFVSEGVVAPNGRSRAERFELDIAGKRQQWKVRCWRTLLGQTQQAISCDLLPRHDQEPSSLVLFTGSGEGYLLGPTPMTVVMPNAHRRDISTWEFIDTVRSTIATSKNNSAFRGRKVTVRAAREAEHELILLTTLVLDAVVQTGEDPNERLSLTASYRLLEHLLTSCGLSFDRRLAEHVDMLKRMQRGEHADLLAAHQKDRRCIDRESGSFIARRPWFPRLAVGFQLGGAKVPTPDGDPGRWRGGSVEATFGFRTKALLTSFAFGAIIGPVDGDAFSKAAEAKLFPGAGFAFGLQSQLPLARFRGIEPTLGISLGLRIRMMNLGGGPEDDSSAQVGGMIGAIGGLQFPIWRINDVGSRLLLYIDANYERTYWRDAKVVAPMDNLAAGERLRQALNGNDDMLRVVTGIRIEL